MHCAPDRLDPHIERVQATTQSNPLTVPGIQELPEVIDALNALGWRAHTDGWECGTPQAERPGPARRPALIGA